MAAGRGFHLRMPFISPISVFPSPLGAADAFIQPPRYSGFATLLTEPCHDRCHSRALYLPLRRGCQPAGQSVGGPASGRLRQPDPRHAIHLLLAAEGGAERGVPTADQEPPRAVRATAPLPARAPPLRGARDPGTAGGAGRCRLPELDTRRHPMNRLLLALSLLATLLAGLASPVVAASQAQSADQLLGELGLSPAKPRHLPADQAFVLTSRQEGNQLRIALDIAEGHYLD